MFDYSKVSSLPPVGFTLNNHMFELTGSEYVVNVSHSSSFLATTTTTTKTKTTHKHTHISCPKLMRPHTNSFQQIALAMDILTLIYLSHTLSMHRSHKVARQSASVVSKVCSSPLLSGSSEMCSLASTTLSLTLSTNKLALPEPRSEAEL